MKFPPLLIFFFSSASLLPLCCRAGENKTTNEEAGVDPAQAARRTSIVPAQSWPFFGYDQQNTNFNPVETKIAASTVKFLRREWETFNDDALTNEDPPTGFALEAALGLEFPTAVVGITASPLVDRSVLYYVDQLGTVFARDARTGVISNPRRHWTTTLVDPDFDNSDNPVLPELFYTAPVLTDDYIWLIGSVFGQVHAVRRFGQNAGQQLDFDPSTPEIDPFPISQDMQFASVLGDSIIIEENGVTLLIVSVNVILNDALVGNGEVGSQVAFDISNPQQPVLKWRTFSIDIDPATGMRFGSGVSVGAGLSVDKELGYIFGGLGQNTDAPYVGYPDPDLAPDGYVDRSDSLYAINYRTGAFVWFNQFHEGDVFNLNSPVGTGPNNPDGPRDADVLSPPVLYTIDGIPYASVGSKGGLYRSVNRKTGKTIWERQISQRTGIGGIQAGGASAGGVVYVAGFEGIDDGFSDAQFGSDVVTGNFPNAFFATFSPAFWADVENTQPDSDPSTGMRIKVYALDGKTGASKWKVNGQDFVELLEGAALRHVSVANDVVFVTTTSGKIIALRAQDGEILFQDQTRDLNAEFNIGLNSPLHAGMNSGAVVALGMVYAPFAHQNNPSGGLFAYEINKAPVAKRDTVSMGLYDASVIIKPLENDFDRNGDAIQIIEIAGQAVNLYGQPDGKPDWIAHPQGEIVFYNVGEHPIHSSTVVVEFIPSDVPLRRTVRFEYTIEDVAPNRIVNGQELNEPNPTHTPRTDTTRIVVRKSW